MHSYKFLPHVLIEFRSLTLEIGIVFGLFILEDLLDELQVLHFSLIHLQNVLVYSPFPFGEFYSFLNWRVLNKRREKCLIFDVV